MQDGFVVYIIITIISRDWAISWKVWINLFNFKVISSFIKLFMFGLAGLEGGGGVSSTFSSSACSSWILGDGMVSILLFADLQRMLQGKKFGFNMLRLWQMVLQEKNIRETLEINHTTVVVFISNWLLKNCRRLCFKNKNYILNMDIVSNFLNKDENRLKLKWQASREKTTWHFPWWENPTKGRSNQKH